MNGLNRPPSPGLPTLVDGCVVLPANSQRRGKDFQITDSQLVEYPVPWISNLPFMGDSSRQLIRGEGCEEEEHAMFRELAIEYPCMLTNERRNTRLLNLLSRDSSLQPHCDADTMFLLRQYWHVYKSSP